MFGLRYHGSSYAADCTLIWNIHAEASQPLLHVFLSRRSSCNKREDTEQQFWNLLMSISN